MNQTKLEVAFVQFIKEVVTMRREQTTYDKTFASPHRKKYREGIVDQALTSMGITNETNIDDIKKLMFDEKASTANSDTKASD